MAGHNPALLIKKYRMRVLVVDKEHNAGDVIREVLIQQDLKLHHVTTGAEALKIAPLLHPHLIILEVDLEDISGIELCSDLRNRLPVQATIVFYSSKEEEFVRVVAYDSGADDFILKHKKPYYLRSKINSILRRSLYSKNDDRISLNIDSRVIMKGGKTIYLSKKEFEIFQLLYSKPNQVINRLDILKVLWDLQEEKSRMLDVHISHLRSKLGESVIKTIKGIGYSFVELS